MAGLPGIDFLANLGRGMYRAWQSAADVGPLPETFRSEPIVAYKTGRIALQHSSGKLFFLPVIVDLPYSADADAVCTKGCKREDIPRQQCKCGFYGLKSRAEVGQTYSDRTLLTVEFSGRVIGYRYGYRAAHQRVIDVAIRPECIPAPIGKQYWSQAIRGCGQRASVLEVLGYGYHPLCDRHASARRRLDCGPAERSVFVTPYGAAEALGTNVRWAS